MTEQDLHDYNKWLMEVWNPNQIHIPFATDAPSAYLKYRAEQFSVSDVVGSEERAEFCECDGEKTYRWDGADLCQWCSLPFKEMANNVSTMVERLKDHGILGDVRQRVGAKTDNDSLFDDKINEMTPDEIMYEWVGWKLGYGSWWHTFKDAYDRICRDF